MPSRLASLLRACALPSCMLLVLSACAAEPAVYLRIRNSGELAFEHVWQGLPQAGSDHDFGRVDLGQTSHWHAFPAALPHYRKTRVQPERGRQLIDVIDPMRWVGRPELPPGHYTLVYALRGAQLHLHVVDEGAVAPRDRAGGAED